MKKLLILAAVLIVTGGVFWSLKGLGGDSLDSQAVKYTDPTDAVDSLYSQWLKAAQDPAVMPDRAALAKSAVFDRDLRDTIADALKSGAALDPVLCQSAVPQGITLRTVYEQADKAQLLVTSKDKAVTNQAIVTLAKSSDSWSINEIECTSGEFAPEKEFSFEKEGFLIQSSVPKPYNNKNWHIVFTEEGRAGNVAPLLFDAKSQCTSLNGTKAACKLDQFSETSQVRVRGQMTERGVMVVHLEFVK